MLKIDCGAEKKLNKLNFKVKFVFSFFYVISNKLNISF